VLNKKQAGNGLRSAEQDAAAIDSPLVTRCDFPQRRDIGNDLLHVKLQL
jgi:hypothetical protein